MQTYPLFKKPMMQLIAITIPVPLPVWVAFNPDPTLTQIAFIMEKFKDINNNFCISKESPVLIMEKPLNPDLSFTNTDPLPTHPIRFPYGVIKYDNDYFI